MISLFNLYKERKENEGEENDVLFEQHISQCDRSRISPWYKLGDIRYRSSAATAKISNGTLVDHTSRPLAKPVREETGSESDSYASIRRGRAGRTGKTGEASAVRDRRDRDRSHRSRARGKKHPDNALSLATRASLAADRARIVTRRAAVIRNPIKKARRNGAALRYVNARLHFRAFIGDGDGGTDFVIPFDTFRDIRRAISPPLHARAAVTFVDCEIVAAAMRSAQHVIGKSRLLYTAAPWISMCIFSLCLEYRKNFSAIPAYFFLIGARDAATRFIIRYWIA